MVHPSRSAQARPTDSGSGVVMDTTWRSADRSNPPSGACLASVRMIAGMRYAVVTWYRLIAVSNS
jgi:hypothetical protein